MYVRIQTFRVEYIYETTSFKKYIQSLWDIFSEIYLQNIVKKYMYI